MTHYQERVAHFYREFRQHQWDHDGGGARPGHHALAAYQSARSHVYFLDRLSADVAEAKRRSKAAKKGWRKRRA